MTNYIFAYHGGKMPANPEDGTQQRAKFNDWVTNLGDAIVNPGTPLGISKIVSSEGVSDDVETNPLLGFSILKAESMDDALEIAKGCPIPRIWYN